MSDRKYITLNSMDASEIEQLWIENARLTKQNEQLIKAVEILIQKPFNDCFNYVCQSPNECQAFGCRVQNKIKQIQNEAD
jgi:hypothetical protein